MSLGSLPLAYSSRETQHLVPSLQSPPLVKYASQYSAMRSATQTPVQFSVRRFQVVLSAIISTGSFLNLLFSSSALLGSSLSLGLLVVDFLVVAADFLVVLVTGAAVVAAGRLGCGFGLGFDVVVVVVVVRLVVFATVVVLRGVVTLVVVVVIFGVVDAGLAAIFVAGLLGGGGDLAGGADSEALLVTQQLPSPGQKASESMSSQKMAKIPFMHSPSHSFSSGPCPCS